MSIDKRILNILGIVFLSFATFSWTFWIFHQTLDILVVAVVVAFRILASILIFKDYSLAWSRATAKTFLLKIIVFLVPLLFYVPIFYGYVRIALFLSEFAFFILVINFTMYFYAWYANRSTTKPNKTLVIYGAGSGGMKIYEELKNTSYKLLGFVDDDENLQKRSIDGIDILSKKKLKDKVKKANLLIIAIPSLEKSKIKLLYGELSPYFEEIKILPSLSEILRENNFVGQLKNISIEDLLARNPKDLDRESISDFIRGKNILVTGAGGSIGSEITRQCIKYKAKNIYALDSSEFNLYILKEELKDNIKTIMINVLQEDVLRNFFANHKVDIVVHAAAYKHVPLVEENIASGLKNNILGTKNCVDLADEFGVKKFILISTDKAVRPTSVMGASKRICELYSANKQTKKMEIVAVRFGNVLGSSGSVIPKFYAQIQKGENITVTHPEITRYFMLICEACELVLQSGALGSGGEVFILDMGEPVKIVDLAKKMIELSGKKGIGIDFIGLRAGEKMYEELLIDANSINTKYPSIFISQNSKCDIKKLQKQINELFKTENKIKKLKEILPEFEHKI
ncbi:MAG: dTDP-glucose 4,6-dehydratase [Proteobacteria bacterium]|nr:MAG: dTDP-glucose 4,6-dehydratase [Pseudomonadota bacterium]